MEKLKQRWNITSNFQLGIILLVFAITGSTSAYLSKPVLEFVGLERETTSAWIYYPLYVILIFPMYKVLLLGFGYLFGQFDFFRNFVAKMLARMGLGFILRPAD